MKILYHRLSKLNISFAGWVGVVNRKQDETDAGKDMDYIEKEEKKFFQNSKFYS